jgi:tetratricopeptide (TPR) repeat protein
MSKSFGIILVLAGILLFSCQKKIIPAGDSIVKLKPYDTATFDYIYVETIKHKLLGNNGEALKLLEQCLKINQSSDAVYFQMAQIVLALGDANTGKKYALKAYSINPENLWYQMILAGTYYQENNLDSAIIFYEKAVAGRPGKENLQVTLGNLYSESKKFDKANEIFEDLDEKYGINKASTASEVRNLIRSGNYEEAEKKAQMLIREYPDEVLYNGILAEIYRKKGENEKAMEVYEKLLERTPDNPETQLSLCDFLINEKNYEGLVNLLNTVILNEKIMREDKISLFARLIEIPEIVKKYGEKLQLSLMVLEASYKKDEVISILRPELLIAEAKLKEAAIRLEEIIASNPENYYAWEKLLLVYFQEKDYKMLQKRGEECATKFNRSFLAKLLFATGASENKDYDTALEELRKANILAGDNKELLLQVLSLRADVYYKMKDYDNAFRTFDEALKNNNEDLTVLNNYAYYLAEQNSRLKEAEAMAEKVIEKEGTNTTFLDTYAWVLYKRGKLKNAEKIMESVINSGENADAEWYEHYGYILRKRNNCESAVKYWDIALKLDSTKTWLINEIEKCQNVR